MDIYSLVCLVRGHRNKFVGVTWADDGTEVSVFRCSRCQGFTRRLLPPLLPVATWTSTHDQLPDGRELEITPDQARAMVAARINRPARGFSFPFNTPHPHHGFY